jgi:hypothetical protein
MFCAGHEDRIERAEVTGLNVKNYTRCLRILREKVEKRLA